MVVVDDGSTDETGSIAANFAAFDSRIRVTRQQNAGVSAARNRGLAETDTLLVLFLDGDDWLAPDAFARLERALEAEPDAVAAHGRYCFVAENAAPGCEPLSVKRGRLPRGDLLPRLLTRNLFANGGHMLIRRFALARRDAVPDRPRLWRGLGVLGSGSRSADRSRPTRARSPAPYSPAAGRAPTCEWRRTPTPPRRCLDAIFNRASARCAARAGAVRGSADSAQADACLGRRAGDASPSTVARHE